MNIEVLISCMHLTDAGPLLQESALNSNAVIVNQCDEVGEQVLSYLGHRVLCISTAERGLSRSRNRAIANSTADICIISDDDEVYTKNYGKQVAKAYSDYPDADIILFQVDNAGKTYRSTPFRVGYLHALRFASWNITFRRNAIIEKGIRFDEKMGSGTGNGSGEEIKFLFDCLHAGLRIQYVPVQLATMVKRGESQWFHGFDTRYFRNRGWATARYMGKTMALLYGLYFVLFKNRLYKHDISPTKACFALLKGVFEKR